MLAQYFDILVLLVVVLVIFQRLKSSLGTRPDESEKARIAEENATKIYDMLVKEAESKYLSNGTVAAAGSGETPSATTELTDMDKVFMQIPNFNKSKFLDGAKRAFEIIIEAFAKGDVQTLEMLVSKKLLKKFQEIIEQRRADGIVAETEFIGFDKADIKAAKIDKNDVAKIAVDFVSQQVNLLKNQEGEVIQGDDQFIQCIKDVWTFERALTSSNLNWILVSTKK